jgi:hypothetical protein
VDVIAGFQATNYPGEGGLTLEEVGEALGVFAKQNHLAAIEVTGYNPTKDPDGSGAKLIIDLLTEVLGARLEALKTVAPAAEAAAGAPTPAPAPPTGLTAKVDEVVVPTAAPGEAWSSDTLVTEPAEASGGSGDGDSSSAAAGTSDETSDAPGDAHSQ